MDAQQTIDWLRGLAEKGGKGVVDNIDARSLGRIADELERLRAELARETDRAETVIESLNETRNGLEAERASLTPVWQPIETAPKMKTVLLFAVVDVDENGRALNWKMDTGYLSDVNGWVWEGRRLAPYDVTPTHWQPLPIPPVNRPEMTAGEEKA